MLLISTALQAESPVKIYIMAGQSNMQGKGPVEGEAGNSLRHLVRNDAKKEYQFLVGKNGEWAERDDVWIHYDLYPFQGLRHGLLQPGYGSAPGQIGPELGFGHLVRDAENGQVLLIKAAWGGKSLGHDFLPPSIGKYPKPLVPEDPGYFYQRTLDLVSEVSENIGKFFPGYKGQGMEIAGFCWHQGWNDQYGGLDVNYETHMAAFIKDIRSVEHGLGVPNLPFVIASSGMIPNESPVVKGQLAMADARKYPEFAGNVAVINTDKPYGPDNMGFKFGEDGLPTDKVGYHWNSSSLSYLNIGRAMAAEILKLDKPKQPSRLTAHGSTDGIVLNWQLGSEMPTGADMLRNGVNLGVDLKPGQTTYTDTAALPGANNYELVLDLPSGKRKLSASCDTSATGLKGYRGLGGVVLGWEARGKYDGFRISRDGKVIADDLAGDVRTFEDKTAPDKGKVSYAVEPTTGKATPSTLVVNLGPPDSGGAIIYEPFDYPADTVERQSIIGKSGAIGTKGAYAYLSDKNPERAAVTIARSLSFGDLPVTGNRGGTGRWCAPTAIELDGSLAKAGLLEDGATLWMSYVFINSTEFEHRKGGGTVTLRSEDMKEGIGFNAGGQYETVVVLDGKKQVRRITSSRPNAPMLVVARITWGKNGENDSFVPFQIGPDLKLPVKEGRHAAPFNIDQAKLSRLVLEGEGQFDEIRVGPTFESVIGRGE